MFHDQVLICDIDIFREAIFALKNWLVYKIGVQKKRACFSFFSWNPEIWSSLVSIRSLNYPDTVLDEAKKTGLYLLAGRKHSQTHRVRFWVRSVSHRLALQIAQVFPSVLVLFVILVIIKTATRKKAEARRWTNWDERFPRISTVSSFSKTYALLRCGFSYN